MAIFLLGRILQAAALLLVMSLVVFFGIYVIGNPIDVLISPEAEPAEIQKAMVALGLDKPLPEQYLTFLGKAVTGDLGRSFVNAAPALQLIFDKMPATLELAFAAMLIAIGAGVPLGLYAGLRPDAKTSQTIMTSSVIGFSLPSFWVGLMLIMVFAVELGWLPSGGRGPTRSILSLELSITSWEGLRYLVLPALTLALYKLSLIIRLTRTGAREAMTQDYIRFARAKGLSDRRIIGVHVLKNILIPLVTVLGIELGGLIAFAVVTETIFSWPGMGKLIIDSINVLDRPVIVAYLMVIVLMFVTINLVVDVLYTVLDPRVRLKAEAA